MQFDIVLLGSGISCTQTLLRLLSKLETRTIPYKKISIAVVEKDGEFWKGIAYGRKSSVNSLIITTLAEFIPEDEKQIFLSWLKTNQSLLLKQLNESGGETARSWIKNNQDKIRDGSWDELYIPRFLYGSFAAERIRKVIASAEEKDLANVMAIKAEAIDISATGQGSYEITLEDQSKKITQILAKKIVLTIGSGNNKPIQLPAIDETLTSPNLQYINDPYFPAMDQNLKNISHRLSDIEDSSRRNILILGSNASSLELLYFISTNPSLYKPLNKVIVISKSGTLAHRISPKHLPVYTFSRLEALKQQKGFDATKLFDTIKKDVEIACSKNMPLGDLVDILNSLVVELLGMLGEVQEKEFYGVYGTKYSKLIRRAGAEYRDNADALLRSGKLTLLKGSFLRIKKSAEKSDNVLMEYETLYDKTLVYPLSFPIVINCGGFEDLEESTSPIIANLLKKKVCLVNKTKRGFEVSENFEAAKNIYVLGPLLGGIFNQKVKHWHVENLRRIHDMAPMLVEDILKSFENKPVVSR